ncbi:UbiA family prenyltransferase [Actinosynnema pretiosum]|uniref:1,4-dihydroxy-2-naphthoate prenyltransferase n=1 Tax=Actinosynnema pretiosum TaxID=42197 RepID=A0A290Z821_9PSEU|nr:UbiA family prenyltransferase [Actinosynnema pretiosum]ATE55146.1 1,4-dihydroxy-2-naphthoate prenyltransferase [Actinosynnema pretiosum]
MSGARTRAEDALGATQPLGTATQPVDLSEITAVTPAVVDPPAHHPAHHHPAPGWPAHGRPALDVTQPVGRRIGSAQRMPAVTGRVPLAAYARLAKPDAVDHHLGVLLAWTLLAPALRLDGRVLATTTAFLLGGVLVIAASVALDDLAGFRDGSDATNCGPDRAQRKRARKPLVTGALTERQVIGFAQVTGAAGVALWTAAVLMAPHSPPWVVLLIAVTCLGSLQCSWGVRLGYRGFQELLVAGVGWALVLAPHGLAAGEVDGFALVQALLFGMGPLLVAVYSNTDDVAGDRAVGRPTVAALTTPSGNALFVMGLTTAEMALMVVAPVVGAPWWFLAAMTPTFCLRVAQLRTGFGRGDVPRARTLGARTHRVTTAVLLVVNLVVR